MWRAEPAGLYILDKLRLFVLLIFNNEEELMRLFISLILQLLIFLPLTSLAADNGGTPIRQNHHTTAITAAQKAEAIKTYGRLPLYFIENNGEVDGQVSFYERGAGHATFFTKDGVVLSLTKSDGKVEKTSLVERIKNSGIKTDKKVITEALSLSFIGANKNTKITADDKMPGHVNYFIGNDRSKWRSDIPAFGAVTYENIYKNIDIKFYGNNKNIEHDVIVRPGGDPSAVRFAYKGIKGLQITENGGLNVSLTHGKIIEKRPVVYQEIGGKRVAVDGAYRLIKGDKGAFSYGFKVASYDKTKDLIIDPVLVYSTYLGGSGQDNANAIAVDSTGAVYVTGQTDSVNFPLLNPIQPILSGYMNIFITKLNPAGTSMVYSTYLGGSSGELGLDIAVDSAGNAYITGDTDSPDFPLLNPVQPSFGGVLDAFITKLNPAGSALVYSTYLGGSADEVGKSIALTGTGAAVVTGYTASSDFPVFAAIQPVYAGGSADVFITKINPSGTAFDYSTYLGGGGADYGEGIALDSSDGAHVTGSTSSTDFPLVAPIQAVFGGFFDAFEARLSPTGSALTHSTYLGGIGGDFGMAIAVDSAGFAYITGTTSSPDFPTLNAMQGVYGGGYDDAFITKINPTGTVYAYSTYLGGSFDDYGLDIALNGAGSLYITGRTNSLDFPMLTPIQGVIGGLFDSFVTKTNATGTALVYSTYLGGANTDYGYGIAVDSAGNAYVAGWTKSADFPLVSPAIVGGYGGGLWDGYVSKISDTAPLPVITLTSTPDAASVARGSTLGYNVTAANTTASRQCFKYWETVTLPDGSTYPPSGTLFGPVHLCLNAGASVSVHLTHGVPMSTPVGAYVFNAFIGTYPAPVTAEARFNFNITAFSPAAKNPKRSWKLLENGFKK